MSGIPDGAIAARPFPAIAEQTVRSAYGWDVIHEYHPS